jgi:hypothetical protein
MKYKVTVSYKNGVELYITSFLLVQNKNPKYIKHLKPPKKKNLHSHCTENRVETPAFYSIYPIRSGA